MRILFVVRRFSYLKNFEGPLLELAKRGHQLHLLALAGEGKLEGTVMVQRWAMQYPQISVERLPPAPGPALKTWLRARIGMMVDYLRYLEPAYSHAPGLVDRARRRTPSGFLRLLDAHPSVRIPVVRRALRSILQRLESATPVRPALEELLHTHKPDAVLFTPLIALQSEEQDVLTAAVRARLRTVFCVLSWDNLSSKAIIRTIPDVVTVWNPVMRDEARQLHGVPDDRIAVTGAQPFDLWFNRTPSRSRVEFLTRVGLPTDRPFVLWVCSALFRTSPMEARFVRKWIEAIRSSADPSLREASILVRPHPTRMREWAKVPVGDLGSVSVWGANPVDPESRNDYFESLFYSEAVVGLNTSAFLEAAIVGRPVYTVLLPEYRDSQEGTLHFPYLLNVAGGLLHVTREMDEHLDDLAQALRQPTVAAERSRRFVEAFVRPCGMDVNATARFVAVIEDLMQRPPRPAICPPRAGFMSRRLYRWLESRSHDDRVKAWMTSSDELHVALKEQKSAQAPEKAKHRVRKAERRADRERETEHKQRLREDRLRDKQEALERHRAARVGSRGEARR